jgi:putative phosphoribosyl transferase
MLAAIRAARKAGANRVFVAAPVASPEAEDLVRSEADDAVILQTPELLFSIGQWYEHFEQVQDAEVCRLLKAWRTSAVMSARRLSSMR